MRLTPRQRSVLEVFARLEGAGRRPTCVHLAGELDVTASRVHQVLKQLDRKGCTQVALKMRGRRLTAAGREAIGGAA